ncbi:MAG TPA: hypothetical protein VKD90_27205 [Gemmataceae bacterium]|nr:hypothetical protein [Gemmataceae bacterium]
MFESRLKAAQVFLLLSLVLAVTGSVVIFVGPVPVGLFCLAVQAVLAAIGCYLYADTKGYPGLIGIPMGVALGVVGAILILILPDQTEESYIAEQKRLAREGFKPSRGRRKDPGYEVLDKDPSPYD